MTFAELLAELYDDLGYQSSPASAVVARIKRAVNKAHEAIHAEPGMAPLRYGTLPFACVADQARYGLSNVAQVRAFVEATNDLTLGMRSLSWYRSRNPDPASNTGTPEAYIPLGSVATAQVPASTGTGLWIVSSSASDTTPTVTIDAVRIGGYPHSPSATTITGLTRAAIGGGSALTDYIDITQFQLSAVCVGDISLYDASSSGNLLAVIPRGQTSSRYCGFILSPTPSEAITYTVDVEHELLPLVNDDDEPLLPFLFHRLPGLKARMKEYEGKNDERYAIAEKDYARELQKLKYSLCPPEYVAVPGGIESRGGSNLGPDYPAGRWE